MTASPVFVHPSRDRISCYQHLFMSDRHIACSHGSGTPIRLYLENPEYIVIPIAPHLSASVFTEQR